MSSVNYVFIGASNELGAFESGFLARLLGTVPSVLVGAMVTLGVVGLVAVGVPEIRRMDLDRTTAADIADAEAATARERSA